MCLGNTACGIISSVRRISAAPDSTCTSLRVLLSVPGNFRFSWKISCILREGTSGKLGVFEKLSVPHLPVPTCTALINHFVSWQSLPVKFQRSTIVTANQMLLSTVLCFIALCSILQTLTNQQLFQVVKFNCPHFTGAEPNPARLKDSPRAKKTNWCPILDCKSEATVCNLSPSPLKHSISPHLLLQYSSS